MTAYTLESWLETLTRDPHAVGPFCDWLEEQGDPRAAEARELWEKWRPWDGRHEYRLPDVDYRHFDRCLNQRVAEIVLAPFRKPCGDCCRWAARAFPGDASRGSFDLFTGQPDYVMRRNPDCPNPACAGRGWVVRAFPAPSDLTAPAP